MSTATLQGAVAGRREGLALRLQGIRKSYGHVIAADGIDLEPSSFLDEVGLDLIYAPGVWRAKTRVLMRGARRRLRDVRAARDYDLVLVHRESFPVGPAWVERLLRMIGVPYIFDFDDAIYLPAASAANRRLAWMKGAGKAKTAVGGASMVVAGNEHLAGWARKYARRVAVIPTTVDTEKTFDELQKAHGKGRAARAEKKNGNQQNNP